MTIALLVLGLVLVLFAVGLCVLCRLDEGSEGKLD
jgi:hypothetical protein